MNASLPLDGARPQEFIFLLLPQFSMIAFAAAIDPLRLANRAARRPLYSWRTASEGGEPVAASNGCAITTDMRLEDVPRDASIVVCAGLEVKEAVTRPVLTWLRRQSRLGIHIGSVCTGAYILARAGLLDGKRCTIHWENQASFAEEFPDTELHNLLYVTDENIFTCAGGTAAADMMVHMIAEDHGPELASKVADSLVHAPMRGDADRQRLSVPARIGVRHPKLVSVIQSMEANIEDPISPSELARGVSMSTRQLERLFRRYLDRSPKRYYMELRLERARKLLLQTDMSVINVALACGFTSPSHFSKCYRSHFNRTPYRERGTPSGQKERA